MKDRQSIIDRLEGVTGIYANWSSLTTEQLWALLCLLVEPEVLHSWMADEG